MGSRSQVMTVVLAALLTGGWSGSTPAQPYPNRNITIIIPSSAGGPGDVSARLISERMSAILGQTLIIETIAGAGGTIAMARVAKAAPDGYTLMVHQVGFAITPAIYAKLSFDTAKDFVTVGLVNQSSSFLVGRSDLPAKDFAELKAWMAGPGKPARYAHPGAGSSGHLQAVTLLRALGIEASLVPYRGVAPALTDLLGGHIDITSAGSALSVPLMRDGKVKAYATAGSRRDPEFPDIPTFGEVGYKRLERPFWHALFAPSATPRPVLEILNAALGETLNDPQVIKAYKTTGVEAYPKEMWSLEAADAYIRGEMEVWAKAVRDNNVRLE